MLKVISWNAQVNGSALKTALGKSSASLVVYRPEQNLHPHLYLDHARSMLDQENVDIYTLDEVYFTCLRAAICEQSKRLDACLVYYSAVDGEPETIQMDALGRLTAWPTFGVIAHALRILVR
jgi:hypothetical protein